MLVALDFALSMPYLQIFISILVGIGETAVASSSSSWASKKSSVLVVGSANADTFLSVDRLPVEGENLMLLPGSGPKVDVPGGKGCTQAVALSRLLQSSPTPSKCLFIGQLGLDPAGKMLRTSLEEAGVDCSYCGFHPNLPSGRGYVFLQAQTGSVSAVVSGGSNTLGWTEWEHAWEERQKRNGSYSNSESRTILEDELEQIFQDECVRCVLLQREVPEFVNLLIASCVKEYNCSNESNKPVSDGKIAVLLDAGGEDRPISRKMLQLCDYIVPNESELVRLVKSFSPSVLPLPQKKHDATQKTRSVLPYANRLKTLGATNVLVTIGASGSLCLLGNDNTIHWHGAFKALKVVDETGAGDCYRAAFAMAYAIEGFGLNEAMQFASAAGSCSVEVPGAVPSTPDRNRIEERLKLVDKIDCKSLQTERVPSISNFPRGGETASVSLLLFESPRQPIFMTRGGAINDIVENTETNESRAPFPFMIGSRLNSMKDRMDLWTDGKPETPMPRDYVKRQGTIRGLTCVDFNYPQHFGSSFWKSNKQMKCALDEAGLVAGAVCLRYPSKFVRGAMNNPDPVLRKEAIELTKEAAGMALQLGCNEVVVWSAFDGYDYPFQVNYDEKWDQLVAAFQELCDSFPNTKFSLEYKPTDENTRFFTVSSTGAALQLVDDVNRPNMGLTLDVGHMLMAGENPGQSIAMVGRKGKLFGIQLNDGFTRLGAEDGLIFGSVHPSMALEIMYQLYRTKFKGHIYFDTFPQRSDPVKEAEYNIQQAKRFWYAASEHIDESRLRKANEEHDALGVLEIVDEALWNHRA